MATVGALALVGWWADVAPLRAIVGGFETMKPPTAVSLMLLGGALVVLDSARPPLRRAAVVGAAVACGLGTLTLLGYLLGVRTGVDTLLFGDAVRAEGGRWPGRMAPITATCATLSGAAVVLRASHRNGAAHMGGVLVGLTASVALAGYLYDVDALRQVGPYSSIALHTAMSFLLIGVALTWSTPTEGLVGLARRGPAPAVLIRRALPVVFVLPLIVGWLSLQGSLRDWYDQEFGLALVAISYAGIGGAVLWQSAAAVARLDQERGEAIATLASANVRLEDEVARRTESLAAQASVQHASLEALEQGVGLASLDGEVLFLNQAGQALLGYCPAELTELFRAGAWPAEGEDGSPLAPDERPVRRTMETGEASSGQLVVWRRPDGSRVTLRVSTQPVLDRDGSLSGVAIAVADVTEERAAAHEAARHLSELTELNAELEQAVSIKNRFLATATHDMRSPLTAIIGFANLLGRTDIDVPDDQRIGMIKAIERQGRRLEALVQDLLALSVIEGEAISVDPQVVALGPVLHQIAADAVLSTHVSVDVPDASVAFVDPLRLAQMITNLLHNAAKYGRDPITITATPEGDVVTIRVCDHGDGVDPEFVPHLFDRFSTASRAVDPGSRSTGLGLAIVRGLAQLHGGDVWYEPNEPSGACFVLRLPTGPEPLAH